MRATVLYVDGNIMATEVRFMGEGLDEVSVSHSHLSEQIVLVVDGEVTINVCGTLHHVKSGESVRVPPNAPHSIRSKIGARIVNLFCPIREDLLATLPHKGSDKLSK